MPGPPSPITTTENPTFKPYVPPGTLIPEFTVRAVALGAVLGIVFGAVSVYLALRAGIGWLYQFRMGESGGLSVWKAQPVWHPGWYPGATLSGEITPEYLGVGYIIGTRVAGLMFAGGVVSWLVLIPLFKFLGAHVQDVIYPGTMRIAQ